MELIVNVLTDYNALVEERISTKAIERCNERLTNLGISIRQRDHFTCVGEKKFSPEEMVDQSKQDGLMPENGLVMFFSTKQYLSPMKYRPNPDSDLRRYFWTGLYYENCVIILDAVNNAQRFDKGGHRLIDTVILHEIGHHLGLGHSDGASVMQHLTDESEGFWSEQELNGVKNWHRARMSQLVALMHNTER